MTVLTYNKIALVLSAVCIISALAMIICNYLSSQHTDDPPYKYIKASPINLTSGELEINKTYRINHFAPGDDFSNVGSFNISGIIFIAQGTTPTVWKNGSILEKIGVVPTLKQQGE